MEWFRGVSSLRLLGFEGGLGSAVQRGVTEHKSGIAKASFGSHLDLPSKTKQGKIGMHPKTCVGAIWASAPTQRGWRPIFGPTATQLLDDAVGFVPHHLSRFAAKCPPTSDLNPLLKHPTHPAGLVRKKPACGSKDSDALKQNPFSSSTKGRSRLGVQHKHALKSQPSRVPLSQAHKTPASAIFVGLPRWNRISKGPLTCGNLQTCQTGKRGAKVPMGEVSMFSRSLIAGHLPQLTVNGSPSLPFRGFWDLPSPG